ncbi:ABC transporter permease [Yinghuangia aomiensis]|uniref:ABC transporter permease n=1 Tax=Yinghuangia aomiensis TaxID=676205 RepID=UPI0031EB2EB4
MIFAVLAASTLRRPWRAGGTLESLVAGFADVAGVIDACRLESSGQRDTVTRAHRIFRGTNAPFIVSVVAQMLPDLRHDVEQDPSRRIVFVGRDGHPLAIAARVLDPEFFAAHCTEVVLSRVVVESALQDRERNHRARFPGLDYFRLRVADRVDRALVDGASERLTAYLRREGVAVGGAGGAVTLVDDGYKGTIQEMLAGLYPEVDFHGRYTFFAASPHDLHPGNKQGYALHLHADETWQGTPKSYLPSEVGLTFGSSDALYTIEETLHGPKDTPIGIDDQGPRQRNHRFNPKPLDGINPVLVSERYRDPLVREAVKSAGLLAVRDAATDAATDRDAGRDWLGILRSGQDRFTRVARAWVARDPGLAPDVAELFDALVSRSNRRVIQDLDAALSRMSVDSPSAAPVWRRLARMADQPREEQRAFAAAGPALARSLAPYGMSNRTEAPTAQPSRLADTPELAAVSAAAIGMPPLTRLTVPCQSPRSPEATAFSLGDAMDLPARRSRQRGGQQLAMEPHAG